MLRPSSPSLINIVKIMAKCKAQLVPNNITKIPHTVGEGVKKLFHKPFIFSYNDDDSEICP
jgi:hypothetical protein